MRRDKISVTTGCSLQNEYETTIVALFASLGSPSGSNPSDFSRILASAFDSLDSL